TWIETTREATLDNVVFRGEAQGWRDAETQVEWLETIETEHGYRIRKLRYEALPGLWIPALLYEPLELTGKVPVVMNVNGHDGTGKAADYKQIRCINQAKRGMIALNPEWIGMGQLRDPGFVHYKLNQLDLCGTSGVAVHFLSMKRGLDILLSHEHADSERVAVAGLSGGGWQTIFISSLDSRVTLSNPVAGYSSFKTRARHTSDLGDSEQTPVDLGIHADYAVLTAMRAPRPTLLTFNAKDQCCFRADHAMQPLVDAAAPIFQLYGQQSSLRTHVNEDPGTHNFGLDNRQQLYKMFGDFFYPEDEQFDATEIPSEEELLSAEELQVPVPEGNHNFHSLALAQAESLPKNVEIPQSPKARQAWLTFKRSRLREILHIRDYDAKVVQKEDVPGSSERAHTLRFRIGGEWTVPATLLTPENPTKSTVILLADTGRSTLGKHSKQKLDDGHRVLAVDPFYFGESKITQRDFLYGLLVSAVGERPLGIQSSQIQAIAAWAGQEFGQPVDCLAHGPRTSLIALSAAAANPERFQTLDFVGSFESLKDILDQDLTMQDSPELFCFGLLAEFDIPLLRVLANGQ
ncbi:MAG: hypothetical protein KDA80_23070, partial [Planctomycetaceae bacterium]|nr:hypothetical protein [Planctomycetaceae bacterium]